ncbi:hypothetical protein HC024_17325 [Methylococcaceae bacterium WWC4]|nr:hypothetical protein [Methylococcaceae bacterium WWC4]
MLGNWAINPARHSGSQTEHDRVRIFNPALRNPFEDLAKPSAWRPCHLPGKLPTGVLGDDYTPNPVVMVAIRATTL